MTKWNPAQFTVVAAIWCVVVAACGKTESSVERRKKERESAAESDCVLAGMNAILSSNWSDCSGCYPGLICPNCTPSEKRDRVRGCMVEEGCYSRLEATCRTPDGVQLVLGLAKCRNTPECIEQGRCAYANGACIATEVAHCTASTQCERFGKCTARNGACVIGSDADCVVTKGCLKFGLCSVDQHGVCVAKSDADCARSEQCLTVGFCTAKAGECVDTPPPKRKGKRRNRR